MTPQPPPPSQDHPPGPNHADAPYQRRRPAYAKLVLMVVGISLLVPIGQRFPQIAIPMAFLALVALGVMFKRDLDTLRRLRNGESFCPNCGHDLAGDYSEPCPNCGWDPFEDPEAVDDHPAEPDESGVEAERDG